ncbi:hypothetical protein ABBQ32_006711 [Trebouxia sp. C0010 RCD-2024]
MASSPGNHVHTIVRRLSCICFDVHIKQGTGPMFRRPHPIVMIPDCMNSLCTQCDSTIYLSIELEGASTADLSHFTKYLTGHGRYLHVCSIAPSHAVHHRRLHVVLIGTSIVLTWTVMRTCVPYQQRSLS